MSLSATRTAQSLTGEFIVVGHSNLFHETCLVEHAHCSQEVRNDLADGNGPMITVVRGVEDLEVPLQIFVDFEHGGEITTAVAVVWR